MEIAVAVGNPAGDCQRPRPPPRARWTPARGPGRDRGPAPSGAMLRTMRSASGPFRSRDTTIRACRRRRRVSMGCAAVHPGDPGSRAAHAIAMMRRLQIRIHDPDHLAVRSAVRAALVVPAVFAICELGLDSRQAGSWARSAAPAGRAPRPPRPRRAIRTGRACARLGALAWDGEHLETRRWGGPARPRRRERPLAGIPRGRSLGLVRVRRRWLRINRRRVAVPAATPTPAPCAGSPAVAWGVAWSGASRSGGRRRGLWLLGT